MRSAHTFPMPTVSPDLTTTGAIWLAALSSGGLAFVPIEWIGQIYVGELLLGGITLVTLLDIAGRRFKPDRLFWRFVCTLAISGVGYVLSDVIRESDFADYARGWGKILLLGSDITALTALGLRDRKSLWLYGVGMNMGLLLSLLIAEEPMNAWKFGYAYPLSLAAATLVPLVSLRLSVFAFAVLAIVNETFDFRSLGIVCIAVAAALSTRPGSGKGGFTRPRRLAVLLVGGVIVLSVYSVVVPKDRFTERWAESDALRWAGVWTAFAAIYESPIVGFGSWAANRGDLEVWFRAAALDRAPSLWWVSESKVDLFTPHSQLVQAWFEGGVLAVTFFVFFCGQLLRHLWQWAVKRPIDRWSPLHLFLFANSLFAVLASPFAGSHRIFIALSVGLMCARIERPIEEGRHSNQSAYSVAGTEGSRVSGRGVGARP